MSNDETEATASDEEVTPMLHEHEARRRLALAASLASLEGLVTRHASLGTPGSGNIVPKAIEIGAEFATTFEGRYGLPEPSAEASHPVIDVTGLVATLLDAIESRAGTEDPEPAAKTKAKKPPAKDKAEEASKTKDSDDGGAGQGTNQPPATAATGQGQDSGSLGV